MFLAPGRSLRGWGRAGVIDVPAPWVDHLYLVSDTLAAVEARSEFDGLAGTGPLAFGALPFDRSAPARFIVPALLHGRAGDDLEWVSTVSSTEANPQPPLESYGESFNPPSGGGTVGGSADSLRIHEPVSPEEWRATVLAATRRIGDGQLRKVVLARELVLTASSPLDPHELAQRLADAHPHALRFDIDGFIGASPELLVSRFGDVVRSQPMAGTTPRTGNEESDGRRATELLASAKNREEHQITIDMVLDTLLAFTSFVDAEPEPSVVAAGTVQHLATMVEGRLSDPAASVLDLVAALHPTPAVGGFPREAALDLIAELEPHGRGRYAGPVGWVDAMGNGTFAVGLRSASIEGSTARLFAGVGVVEDSDPQSEYEETRAKFAATLGVFTGS